MLESGRFLISHPLFSLFILVFITFGKSLFTSHYTILFNYVCQMYTTDVHTTHRHANSSGCSNNMIFETSCVSLLHSANLFIFIHYPKHVKKERQNEKQMIYTPWPLHTKSYIRCIRMCTCLSLQLKRMFMFFSMLMTRKSKHQLTRSSERYCHVE